MCPKNAKKMKKLMFFDRLIFFLFFFIEKNFFFRSIIKKKQFWQANVTATRKYIKSSGRKCQNPVFNIFFIVF
jgi:hypothetical protein